MSARRGAGFARMAPGAAPAAAPAVAVDPQFIAAGTGSEIATGGGNLQPTYGSNESGDLFLAVGVAYLSNITAPAGWTEVYGPSTAFASMNNYIWVRDARSTGGETGSVNFLSTDRGNARIYTFRNVATSAFIEAHSTAQGNAGAITNPSIVPAETGRLGCLCYMGFSTAGTIVPGGTPLGGAWTEAAEYVGSTDIFFQELQTANLLATVSGGTAAVNGTNAIGIGFALAPATFGVVPSFAAAGNGSNAFGSTAPEYPTNTAGDLFIAHTYLEGSDTASTPAGWTLQHMETQGSSPVIKHYVWTRDTRATGSDSGTVTFTISGAGLASTRIYGITGVATSNFIEDITATTATDGTCTGPSITALGGARLGILLVTSNGGASGMGNVTGETGGDWIEATAEHTSGFGHGIQIQTTKLGAISGGTTTVGGTFQAFCHGFALVGSSADLWTPATPGNLLGWYSASTTYCFEDDAGTDPCEDSEGVAVWKDRSGNSQDLIQTSAGDRPLYQTSGWGTSKPSVFWDGSGDVLARTTGTLISSVAGTDVAFTVFMTLHPTAGSQDQSLASWDHTVGNSNINMRTDNSGNNLIRFSRTDAAAATAGVSGSELTTVHRRIAFVFKGTTISMYIDGVISVTDSASDVGSLTLDRFRLGNGPTGTFTGRFTEVVIYTGDKSAYVSNYQDYSSVTWGA